MIKFRVLSFLLGISILWVFGCGDSEKYNQGKDYYPVTKTGTILHWGKNNSITVDTNFDNGSYSGSPSSNIIDSFKSGLNQWNDPLSSIGVSVVFSTSNPDVKVHWLTASEMATARSSSTVLGYASSSKNIYMRDDLSAGLTQSTAVHEFGHMLGIWTHSFDAKDIMYPYATSVTELSNRDKKTVTDFLYAMTPTYDMHDVSGPLINPENGAVMPHIQTYYTTSGCVVSTDP